MLFQESAYGYFLIAVFALFWMLRRSREWRNLLLLGASWWFYACWDWRFLSLIWLSTALDYSVGRALGATDPSRTRARRWLLTASVVGNLTLLGTFKYYGFFRENLEALLGLEIPALKLLLPVGISFYTFQTLSYTIDIYRGTLKPAKSWMEFALFVAFFPQLVAGPIVRASDFLPQLEHAPWIDRERLVKGLGRIMLGLVKKVAIADLIGAKLVDPVYAESASASGLEATIAMYAFALQVYCDFSGYSDVAIGSARLFGIRIPENFRAPYAAASLTDFWRRWHISLSFWLRDYVYIPLGGSRGIAALTYLNLMITMVLSGLWHGADWKFAIWGALHGAWLGIERFWKVRGLPWLRGIPRKFIGFLFTFHFVTFALVMFRAPDLQTGNDLWLAAAGYGSEPWLRAPAVEPLLMLTLLGGTLLHFTPQSVRRLGARTFVALPGVVHGVLWAIVFGLLAATTVEGTPFIYFQF
jgi:alginate O-acetyltransferase complex protein AlgI